MSSSAIPARFFPYRVIQGWLGERQAAELLSYTVAQEAGFKPAKVHDGESGLDPAMRRSRRLKELSPFADALRERALALQGELEQQFGMSPLPAGLTEIELVAHGDGDFYRDHIDTFTGEHHAPGDVRRLSLVYYLHRQPRAFSRGRLRLFSFAGTATIDVDPTHDSLLAFPSFVRHEIETVHCPSGAFADRRFAVNIWLCG